MVSVVNGLTHTRCKVVIGIVKIDLRARVYLPMQIDLPLGWLIPLCVEQQISGVDELLNSLGVEVLSIGYRERVIVAHILLGQPIGDLILMVVFEVATEAVEASTI
jgi:hypothetical protein